MKTSRLLWIGPVAAVLLTAGVVAIGLATPGYSHARQTVSELGEIGAPGRIEFTTLLLLVAACLSMLAVGAARAHQAMGLSPLPGPATPTSEVR